MKKKLLVMLLSFVMVVTMMPLSTFAETDNTSNVTNKAKAMEEFSIPSENVITSTATTGDALSHDIAKAQDKVSQTKKKAMVYVTENVELSGNFEVPQSIVLCAEKNTVIKYYGDNSRMFVSGSVYGGTYDGNNKAGHVFVLEDTFTKKNGYIMHTYISNAQANGIWVWKGSSGSNILYNNITKCGVNGIRVQPYENEPSKVIAYSSINKVCHNVVTYSKEQSGLDLDRATVNYVQYNKFNHNNGHGISTSTEDIERHYIKGEKCTFKKVDHNEIAYNGSYTGCQGLWLEYNCKITESLDGNTIHDNYTNGLAMGPGAQVKGMSNNKIYNNNNSNFSLVGKNSMITKAYMTSGNKIYSSKTAQGIATDGRVAIHITGNNNEIYNNKANQIYMINHGSLAVTGALTMKPKTDSNPALSFNKFCAVTLKNTKITGKSDWLSVYYDKRCTFYRSNCSFNGRTYINTNVSALPKVSWLKAKALNSKKASVSWGKVGCNAKYLIYRGYKTSGNWGNPIASTTKTSYTDSSVKKGKKNYYMVKPAFPAGDTWIYGSYSPKDYAYPR